MVDLHQIEVLMRPVATAEPAVGYVITAVGFSCISEAADKLSSQEYNGQENTESPKDTI